MRKAPLVRALVARILAGSAISAGVSVAIAAPACAQASEVNLVIKKGPLAGALNSFATATGYQLLYSSELVQGKTSPGASGEMTVEQGLAQVLSGTGLSFRLLDGKTIQISAGAGTDGERVTGAVRVEGAQGSPYFGGAGQMAGVNGINGSRDITATEGTKSFTSGALTIGSKVPQAIKDVPQSISVLTSERLDQQNVTDLTSAMGQLPGITLVQGESSLENVFYSRGFEINSIQVDGGAPLSTEWRYYPQIDMSVYDHVELLRGANGLFDGYGDPAGTVNLVRKKPLEHGQILFEGQVGSWNHYRAMIDATSPLALDGRLRGRLVMTYQDNGHFYDIAKDNKLVVYGVGELDVTSTTLLTAGINFTRQDSVPWFGGLPRYENGEDLELPRSRSLAFPWNRWDFRTTELFGRLEQSIGDDWTLKLNLTHNKQASTRKIGYSTGAVNPLTGAGPRIRGTYDDTASDQLSAEASLTGAFTIFGQRQEVAIGVNRVKSDGGGLVYYNDPFASSASAPYQPYPGGPSYCYVTYGTPCPAGTIGPATPPIDVFDFDPDDPLYTEPANSLPFLHNTALGTTQIGAFVNLRLTAFDRLHLSTGLRWSSYKYVKDGESLCPAPFASPRCIGKEAGYIYATTHYGWHHKRLDWPPTANLSFDVTRELTVYAGYNKTMASQGVILDKDHKPLDPITGANAEVGVKWAPNGGRLNLSLAAYRITQDGFLDIDWSVPFENVGGASCCFLVNPDRSLTSKGFDLEATGEIFPGWQLAGSYTFSRNKRHGSYYGGGNGKPFTSIQPKHLFKLWTSYDFGAAGRTGPLSGLTLSGGLNGQSSAYYAGFVCVNPKTPPPPPGSTATCASNRAPDTVPFEFTVPGHTVVSGRMDYRISPTWSLAVNVENIFDKTYYQTVGSYPTGGNWYGRPRSVTATLQAKW